MSLPSASDMDVMFRIVNFFVILSHFADCKSWHHPWDHLQFSWCILNVCKAFSRSKSAVHILTIQKDFHHAHIFVMLIETTLVLFVLWVSSKTYSMITLLNLNLFCLHRLLGAVVVYGVLLDNKTVNIVRHALIVTNFKRCLVRHTKMVVSFFDLCVEFLSFFMWGKCLW